MNVTPLVQQIADQLASARCEQDLDNELSHIPEPHWHLFVESMFPAIREMEATEPQRAQALRSLMHTYLARRHHQQGRVPPPPSPGVGEPGAPGTALPG